MRVEARFGVPRGSSKWDIGPAGRTSAPEGRFRGSRMYGFGRPAKAPNGTSGHQAGKVLQDTDLGWSRMYGFGCPVEAPFRGTAAPNFYTSDERLAGDKKHFNLISR